jgi:catechol 2,3-dioxygenase-like lactoylglutathione lyase family enzyme
MSVPADEWIVLPELGAEAHLPGTGALGALAFDHIGMAVYDADDAMRRFTDLLGLEDWSRVVFEGTAECNGVRQPVGAVIALAKMGPLLLELVQPTVGQWAPSEFLKQSGEGVYHLGFRVPDVAASAARAESAGLHVANTGLHGNVPFFSYTDRGDLSGLCLEFISPLMPTDVLNPSSTWSDPR